MSVIMFYYLPLEEEEEGEEERGCVIHQHQHFHVNIDDYVYSVGTGSASPILSCSPSNTFSSASVLLVFGLLHLRGASPVISKTWEF